MAVSLFGKWQLPGHLNFDWLCASRALPKYIGEEVDSKEHHMKFIHKDARFLSSDILALTAC